MKKGVAIAGTAGLVENISRLDTAKAMSNVRRLT